jgi:phosphate:Na+ symporter
VLSSFLNFAFGTVDIYHNHLDMTIGLSAFHTAFNLINSLILINFIAPLSKLASIGLQTEDAYSIIKDKTRIKFLENTGNMPEMATIQLQKETKRFGEIIVAMATSFKEIINTTDIKKQQKLIKKTKQYEELTDQLEVEITEYITLLSKEEMTSQTSLILRTILNVCNDLERIADIYFQLSIILQKKKEENVYFVPEQREKINELASLVEDAIRIMNENLAVTDYRSVKKYQAVKSEKRINQYRDLMREEHLNRMGQPDYNIKSAMVYNNVFQSLERIGDHIVNVTEAVVGEI